MNTKGSTQRPNPLLVQPSDTLHRARVGASSKEVTFKLGLGRKATILTQETGQKWEEAGKQGVWSGECRALRRKWSHSGAGR